MKRTFGKLTTLVIGLCVLCMAVPAVAQTDIDGIMMEKNAFCVGPMYSYSSWKKYWEGTNKRENLNLGRVSTQTYSVMGAYGVTKNINLLFNVPYVRTKATDGTLHGMKGFQDLSFFVKWKAYQRKLGDGKITLFGIGGLSVPMTDYTPDFLPLSIGLHSKQLMARAMADYQQGNLFATGSFTFIGRDNIKIDRDEYYTTELHLTNEVKMYNALNYNFRAGFRNQRLIAEAIYNRMETRGGFDITKNNMPFPSNRMNATSVGVNVKYVIPMIPQLSIVAGGTKVIGGRNVGQATGVYGSFFYVFDLSKKIKSSDQSSNTN